MAKKRKGELSSGNIRVRVYDYTDESGKKIYRSFTAPTRAEATAMANEWKECKRELKKSLTVYKACENYIELKSGVLSPYTVQGYRTDLKRIHKYKISSVNLKTLSNIDLQQFVSELAGSVSPKTTANTVGLITAALSVYIPSFNVRVTLPERKRAITTVPEQDEVKALLEHCDSTEMKLAIILAAKYTLRRGEVCALTFKDIDYANKRMSINKSFVKVENHYWEIKSPKTPYSFRTLSLSDDVIDAIMSLDQTREYVINMNPDQFEHKYQRLKKKANVNIRYHDLRHHAASLMHAAGIPQRYIEAEGGWRPGSKVLTDVYQHTFESEKAKIDQIINSLGDFSI